MSDKLLSVASLAVFSCLFAVLALLVATAWRAQQFKAVRADAFAAETLGALAAMAMLVSLGGFFGLSATLPAALAILPVVWLQRRVSSRTLLRRVASTSAMIAAGAIIYYVCLRYPGVWLRESYNHDLVLYVRGGQWARNAGTLIDDALVNLGTMSGRSTAACYVWIGNACSLNRSGTHTIAAIPAVLSGIASPFGACIGVLILCVPLVAALRYVWSGRGRLFSLAGALLLAASPPVLSALWNGNIATAAGALVVIIAAVVALSKNREPRRLTVEASILGLCAGLGAHVYSESMWMVLGIGSLFYLRTLILTRSLRGTFSAVPAFLVAWLLSGNVAVLVAVRGVLTVASEVVRNVNWEAYYLDQGWWSWLTAPFAGQMSSMDHAFPALLGYAGTATAIVAGISSSRRVGAVLVLLLATLAFAAIEITSYRYGTNKVVQLLGALPLTVGIVVLGDLSRSARKRPLPIVAAALMALALVLSVVNFASRADDVAKRLQPKAIASGDEKIFSVINQGDVVLVNDLSWTPDSRFSKSNWSHYLIQEAGGVPVAGPLTEPYRGGYHTFDLSETERLYSKIQWVLQSPRSKLVYYPVPAVVGGKSFELSDLRGIDVPAVFQGNGWYEREKTGTWTSPGFTLQTSRSEFDALSSGEFATLAMQLAYFNPPSDGTVSILMDGKFLRSVPQSDPTIGIPVPSGYHTFSFVPSWPVTSPEALGQSTDTRQLFALVRRIDVGAPDAQKGQ